MKIERPSLLRGPNITLDPGPPKAERPFSLLGWNSHQSSEMLFWIIFFFLFWIDYFWNLSFLTSCSTQQLWENSLSTVFHCISVCPWVMLTRQLHVCSWSVFVMYLYIQDEPHRLWVSVKIKMKGPLLRSYYEFQDSNSRALNHTWGPSEHKGPVPLPKLLNHEAGPACITHQIAL